MTLTTFAQVRAHYALPRGLLNPYLYSDVMNIIMGYHTIELNLGVLQYFHEPLGRCDVSRNVKDVYYANMHLADKCAVWLLCGVYHSGKYFAMVGVHHHAAGPPMMCGVRVDGSLDVVLTQFRSKLNDPHATVYAGMCYGTDVADIRAVHAAYVLQQHYTASAARIYTKSCLNNRGDCFWDMPGSDDDSECGSSDEDDSNDEDSEDDSNEDDSSEDDSRCRSSDDDSCSDSGSCSARARRRRKHTSKARPCMQLHAGRTVQLLRRARK